MEIELLTRSEELLKEIDRIDKFGTMHGIYPYETMGKLAKSLNGLSESMEVVENPKTQEQVIASELKRRLRGNSFQLNQMLSSEYPDFNVITSLFGIPTEDINSLKGWLSANKEATIKAIERLYESGDVKQYELRLQADIPQVAEQAAGYLDLSLKNHHHVIGAMLQKLTNVGGFLRDIKPAVTTDDRSYFNGITKTLAISLPGVCFTTEKGLPQIRKRELVEVYGHEGMGHGLNRLLTDSATLPFFLTSESLQTSSTAESVAQFYERRIFEDLRKNPDVLKELDLLHKFDDMYGEHKAVELIEVYKRALGHYAIFVLGDKSFGDPKDPEVVKRKIETLEEVTFAPGFPVAFVEGKNNRFDSQGNLDYKLTRELRYCAQPVQRALQEFEKQGILYEGSQRSLIDRTLLTGFWTPQGYVENAKLKSREAAIK